MNTFYRQDRIERVKKYERLYNPPFTMVYPFQLFFEIVIFTSFAAISCCCYRQASIGTFSTTLRSIREASSGFCPGMWASQGK